MFSADQIARLSMLRLQAAMISAGFSKITEVAFKILPEDDISELVREICGADASLDSLANGLRLERLYGREGAPTHIVVASDLVALPDGAVEILAGFRRALTVNSSTQFGWMIAVDRRNPRAPGLTVRLSTGPETKKRPRLLNSNVDALADALGVPVRLEVGTIPKQHQNPWAKKFHNFFASGMSIGGGAIRLKGATITMPVRLRASPLDRYFLTVGHLLPDEPALWQVRQPAESEGQDRQIGSAKQVAYESSFDAINYLDAALVRAENQAPNLHFGPKNKFQLLGVADAQLTQGEKAYIYGASIGLEGVRIQYTDVETTMLSSAGNRLIYRDVIEFSRDPDNTQAASFPGDSGAPLLIGKDNKYYVVGLVIGGGGQAGGSNQARSYAVPIQRILDHFQVEPL